MKNVLSLCDGMSCGQIVLRELGIKYDTYYASETDAHCIRQTQFNFPDTVQLGDIEGWRDWNMDWSSVELVFSGTPCTGFSSAGKRSGFEDPGSRLFFVFVDILNHVRKFNPDVFFLFENVRMKAEHKYCISELLGVWPVMIDSARVSAQTRKRLYWSNIRTKSNDLFGNLCTDIPQPKDREIFLRDILEDEVDEKYFLTEERAIELLTKKKATINPKKAHCLTAGHRDNNTGSITLTGEIEIYFILTDGCVKTWQGKANCLTGGGGRGAGSYSDTDLILQPGRGYNKGGFHRKAPTLSANSYEQNNFVVQLNPSTESGGVQPYQQNRIYDINYKSPALIAEMSQKAHAILAGCRIRRLTPLECARLQTVPEWYVWRCSDTQQYKMLGNGWTVEAIKHILSFLHETNCKL
jgi:DNA (cytosine-5)-methyltransferase 3A